MWSTLRFNFGTNNSIVNVFFYVFEDTLNFSKSVQFAEDTVIYYSGKSATNIKEMLNRDLSSISKCSRWNKFILTLMRIKQAMLFGTAKRLQLNPTQLEIYNDETKINVTETYTYLGSFLDPT